MERFNIDIETLVEVSSDAAGVTGTSADLIAGDTLTIWQLLFGLMLPSGNDSAHQLAEFFGAKLKAEAEEIEEKQEKEREAGLANDGFQS